MFDRCQQKRGVNHTFFLKGNETIEMRGKYSWSLLHDAALYDRPAIASLLINNGIYVLHKSSLQYTAFDEAKYNSQQCAQLIQQH